MHFYHRYFYYCKCIFNSLSSTEAPYGKFFNNIPCTLLFFPLPWPMATFTDKVAQKRPLQRRELLTVILAFWALKSVFNLVMHI